MAMLNKFMQFLTWTLSILIVVPSTVAFTSFPSRLPKKETVPVSIERTSPNSRRIGGQIAVNAPIDDVWAILTDYDNLSIHVPNLVESRRVRGGPLSRDSVQGDKNSIQGDGRYRCRLYQRGAQKIIGFEFGASVTLDMKENIVPKSNPGSPEERKISFKCVDSQFFSNFDGEWKVVADPNNENLTTVSYIVDVRPKLAVPVAALEWRIKEDVPTNLLAVRKSSIEDGLEGVLALRARNKAGAVSRALAKVPKEQSNAGSRSAVAARVAIREGRNRVRNIMERLPQSQTQMAPVPVTAQWEDNETMAAYLNKRK